jgi:hypothetical protein
LIKGFKNLLQSIVTVGIDFCKTYFREEKACEALDHIAPQNGEKCHGVRQKIKIYEQQHIFII